MKRYEEKKVLLQELLDVIATYTNDDACEDLELKHTQHSLDKLWKERIKHDQSSAN